MHPGGPLSATHYAVTVTFSHDTRHALQVLVDLVNTAPNGGRPEGLPDPSSVELFVKRHEVSSVSPEDFSDLGSIYRVRDRFCALFGVADPAVVASRVNALLAEVAVRPRVAEHDGYALHVHYFAPEATLAEHLTADGAMALAQVVCAGETERLRVCEAPDCASVLVDLSRNRSKRYCDPRACGNRLNVAAYRERRRSAHRTGNEQ